MRKEPRHQGFTREAAEKIEVGDKVWPDPLWNQTERMSRRMVAPIRVCKVKHGAASQTGVMLTVKAIGGQMLELDAGWFAP